MAPPLSASITARPTEDLRKGPAGVSVWFLLAVGLAAAVMVWTLAQPKLSFDDAYITYRYARNVAQGQGFVYNPGERVLGTTTPLYTLLLAGLSTVWPDLPTASFLLGGLGWAASVLLLYAIGRQAGSPLAGFVAAAFLAFDQLTNSTLGMETTLYVALILLAFGLEAAGRPRAAGLAAGAAFVMRWDGVLVIAVIGLVELARQRRLPWQVALGWLAVAGPWLVFSQLYFGSIFPNTFFAKAGQAQSGLVGGGAESFGLALAHLVRSRLAANPLTAAWLPAGVLSLLNGRRWLRAVGPVWLWALVYVSGFLALRIIGFHWYYAPLVPAVALLVGGGVAFVAQRLAAVWGRWPAVAGAAALAAACLWPQLQYLWDNRPTASAHLATYQQVSAWIAANTAPESSVALLEIGVIGYDTRRPVVDLMGLVSPAMIGHLENWDQAFEYAVVRYWPDYVVALQGMAWSKAAPPAGLRDVYTPVATIDNPADPAAPVLIFKRRSDFPSAVFAQDWPQNLVFDHLFALEDIQAGAHTLSPGQPLPLRLRWSVAADVHADYHFEIDLLNLSTGERLRLRPAGQPMYGGAPTTEWRRGQRYVDDLWLTAPPNLPDGAYRVVVQASLDGRVAEPAQSASGQSEAAMTGVLMSGGPAATPAFTVAPLEFGEGLSLQGYRLAPAAGALKVTLFWKSTQPVPGPLTVFIHLLDQQAQLVGQHDGPPAEGALPVTQWWPGVTVVDEHVVPLASPASARQMCLGLYDSNTQERLSVLAGDGYAIHDNMACRPIETEAP